MRYRIASLLCIVLTAATAAAEIPSTAAIDAARNADVAALRAAIAARVDVNAAQPDGTTALHWAARNDTVAAAAMLLKAGANPKAVNRYGVSPIHLAATNGSAAMLETLLAAGADAKASLPEGETALMTAARTGRVDAVRVLLAHGADVNAREQWRGQTALMWAAAEGHSEMIAALVAAGADVHARSKGAPMGRTPQAQTPESRRTAAPRPAESAAGSAARPEQRPTPPRAAQPLYTFTPLLFAVRAGHIPAVRALLAAGADVNETVSDGTSALVLAVLNAHFELAASLLEAGADPNASEQGWTALHQLAWTRRPNFGRPPPPPVPTGNLDSLSLARTLLDYGADPNAREKREPRDNNRSDLNRIGATPFFLAAKAADIDLMRLLVDYGADPLMPNVDGTTPLMVAAGVGLYKLGESPGTNEEALEAVKLAHELGGDVNTIDDNGDTALHGAALRGANNIVQFLVDKGIKREYIALKNKRDWSPLGIADGIFHISVFIAQPETAALLRKLAAAGPSAFR
jgi:ankyrin repeat protein